MGLCPKVAHSNRAMRCWLFAHAGAHLPLLTPSSPAAICRMAAGTDPGLACTIEVKPAPGTEPQISIPGAPS